MNNEVITKFFVTLLLVVGFPVLIFCMWYGVDIEDLECRHDIDACTIFSRKAFQKHYVKEFFKISEIVSYRIEHRRTSGGRYSTGHDYYYPILVTKNDEYWLYGFSTRSYDRAEMLAQRIMGNRDFEIKGNYYKTFTDRY